MKAPTVMMTASGVRRIDENELAQLIAECEGGEKQMNIGQIKECIRLTLEALAAVGRVDITGVLGTIQHHQKESRYGIPE